MLLSKGMQRRRFVKCFCQKVCPVALVKWFVLWILLMVCPMDFINGLSYGFC